MYLERLLNRAGDERICLLTRPHWFQVARQGGCGLFLMACGVAMLLFGARLTRLISPPISPSTLLLPGLQLDPAVMLSWASLALLLCGAPLLGWALLCRHFTQYAITVSRRSPGQGRILKVQGVFSRQTVAVPIGKVNDLVVYEPPLGRMLGWGHVDIETGNDYTGDRLDYLPDPRRFQDTWRALLVHGEHTPLARPHAK